MKYNEAIDMILDGGEAYRKDTGYVIFFSEYGLLSTNYSPDNDEIDTAEEAMLDKEDFTETDWVVEKDGVVYEEKPNGTTPLDDVYESYKELHDIINKRGQEFVNNFVKTAEETKMPLNEKYQEIYLNCPYCHSKDLMKIKRSDIEPNWYACCSCQWQGIFIPAHPIIADEVNEDWLEKKMLCFMRRHFLLKPNALTYCKSCRDKDCQFCFPENQEILYARACNHVEGIAGIDKCPICTPVKEKKQEKEKVTVDEIVDLFSEYHKNLIISLSDIPEKNSIMDIIKQKLTYLVSLQEKQ